MDRTQELEEQVLRLSQTVDEMRNRMVRLEGQPPEPQNRSAPRSRRGFLRMGLTAAAGAVGWTAVKALPAAAANGGTMALGTAMLAASPTTIKGDVEAGPIGPPTPVFAAEDSAFSQTALTTALGTLGDTFSAPLQGLGGATGNVEGIDAWAAGQTAYAVYGLTDTGTGVTGESMSGIGLYARTTGRIRQDPQGTTVAPLYLPNLMEQVRDANGVLWIHNATGKWRRVNSLRTDTADGLGNPFKPFRLADTRNGTGGVTGPVAGGSTKVFTIAPSGTGASTIPADAIAVVGNITAVGWNQSGWLTIFPAGVAYDPSADPSSMNFSGGAYAWANSFVVGLGSGSTWGGRVAVYVGTLGAGGTNFIIDITGYIQ